MTEGADVPLEVVAKLRSVCVALPEAYEEQAWVGTRWRIRKRTFAHVLMIDSGWPPVYARAAGSNGPITVMTFPVIGARARGAQERELSVLQPKVGRLTLSAWCSTPAPTGTRLRNSSPRATESWHRSGWSS
jgi:hypothetical protein